jgi:hypothetical protein
MKMRIAVPAAALLAMLGAAPAAGVERLSASCMNSAPAVAEPVGDRLGHAVQLVTATCTGSGMDDVTTIQAVWEQDLARSQLLSGDGVVRQRGSLLAYHLSEGVQYPVIKEGRPAGWTATGRGIYTLATGAGAALLNRTFSWIARSTGPQRWLMERHLDD